MEKRIALELRGRTPAQVKELNLDNCRSTIIVGLTDEYCNLETLSLNNVGLTSLRGFPALPNLKRLELCDNRIHFGLNFLNGSPNLTHLNVSENKIRLLEDLEPLKDFGKLKNLDLFNNEVTGIEDYREKVFILIPSLKYLDGFDQEDRVDDEDEMNGNNDSDGARRQRRRSLSEMEQECHWFLNVEQQRRAIESQRERLAALELKGAGARHQSSH